MFRSFNFTTDQKKNPSCALKQIKVKLEYRYSSFEQESFFKFSSLLFSRGEVWCLKKLLVHIFLSRKQFLRATTSILFPKLNTRAISDNSSDTSNRATEKTALIAGIRQMLFYFRITLTRLNFLYFNVILQLIYMGKLVLRNTISNGKRSWFIIQQS